MKKIFLASIRPPKLETERPSGPFRPLYDIPFMFEAREFMRKKLIGQNVHVIVDYIQPESMDVNGYSYPEKICGTVTIGGVNVAEALVSKGNNSFMLIHQNLRLWVPNPSIVWCGYQNTDKDACF